MVESSDIDAGPLLSHAACWYAAATGPGGGAVGGGCVAGARGGGGGLVLWLWSEDGAGPASSSPRLQPLCDKKKK